MNEVCVIHEGGQQMFAKTELNGTELVSNVRGAHWQWRLSMRERRTKLGAVVTITIRRSEQHLEKDKGGPQFD